MQPLTPDQVTQIARFATYVRDNASVTHTPPHSQYTHVGADRAAEYTQFITDLNQILEHTDALAAEYRDLAQSVEVSMADEPGTDHDKVEVQS